MKYCRQKSMEARWKKNISEPDENGCINWLGALDKDGYGRLMVYDGSRPRAHRFSYQKHFGAIPDGMLVCHHCDNPSCVNHEHLFLGTPKQNSADRDKKGRAAKNNLEGCSMKMLPNSKLSKADVLEIRKLIKPRLTLGQIAKMFNVDYSTIYNIKHGKTWYHLK